MFLVSGDDRHHFRPATRVWAAGLALFALIAMALALAGTSRAVPVCTRTGDRGAGTGLFSDAANWAPDGVPAATDHVCLAASGGGTQVVFTGTSTINSIQAAAGGDLPLVMQSGTLTIDDPVNDSQIA